MRFGTLKMLLGLLTLLLVCTLAHAATFRGTPVTVTNDATQAVPVTVSSLPNGLYKIVGVTQQTIKCISSGTSSGSNMGV